MQNFETRSGEFSFTLTLPKTKINNAVFEYANDPHQIDKFRRSVDFAAELFVDGEDILKGNFKLNEVTPDGYNGNLYGLSISWADELEGVNLRALDWEVPYLAAGGGVNEIDDYNTRINSPIRFPLISYFPFPNSNPANNPVVLNAGTLFTIDQMPFETSIKETVRRMFAAIGWEVSGGMFSEDWFKSLYIPYTEPSAPPLNYKTLGGLDAEKFTSFVNIPFTDTTPPDNLFPLSPAVRSIGYENLVITDIINTSPVVSLYNAGGLGSFLPRYRGQFTFEIELRDFKLFKDSDSGVSGIFPPTRVALVLYDNGNPATLPHAKIDQYLLSNTQDIDDNNIIGFYELSEDYGKENISGLAPVVLANDYSFITPLPDTYEGAASLVRVQFPVNLAQNNNIQFLLVTYVQDNFDLTPAATGYRFEGGVSLRVNPQDDENIHPAKILPDITGKDFIKALINKFNLWFTTDDQNKRISFFEIGDFHKPDKQAINLDCLAPIQSGTLQQNNPAKEIKLTYQIDNKDIRPAGSAADFTRNSLNIYAAGVKGIESIFAASTTRNVFDSISSQTFRVVAITSESFTAQTAATGGFVGEFVPRILSFTGTLTGATIPIQTKLSFYNSLIGLNTFNGRPAASDQVQYELNLSFGNTSGLPLGLYERFWRDWVELLERSHIIELRGKITADEYRRLTLDTPIVYNSEIWFLLEINGYSPATGEATIKMIKKVF